MLKKNKLKDISEIISGYSFRGSISSFALGNTYILQSRDLFGGIDIELSNIQKINVEDISTKAYTKSKDVLVSCKGNPTVGYLNNKDPEMLISSSLFIIRVNDVKIIPKFLAIYLNSIKGQKELNKITLGAYIKGISKKNLENLAIPIPSTKVQKEIVSMYDNVIKQRQLLERKADINNSIIDYLLTN